MISLYGFKRDIGHHGTPKSNYDRITVNRVNSGPERLYLTVPHSSVVLITDLIPNL
jgi:hypothetical protein